MLPDGRAVAVWTSVMDTPDPTTVSFQFLENMEIRWAVWDPATQTWSAPAQLTTDAVLDDTPVLEAGADGSLVLVWRANADSFLGPSAEHPDQLLAVEWTGDGWSAPLVVAEGLADLRAWDLATGDGLRAVVMSRGAVGSEDLWLVEGSETAWGTPATLSTAAAADVGPQAVYDGDTLVVTWLRGEDMASRVGADEVVVAAGAASAEWLSSQLHAGPSGVRLTRAGTGAEGAGLYQRTLGADGWSADITMVAPVPLVRAAAADRAGQLHVVGVVPTSVEQVVQVATFSEVAATRTAALTAEWNLVGWSGASGTGIAAATEPFSERLATAFAYDATAQSFLSFSPTGPGFLNTLETLDQGTGLWIRLTGGAALDWEQPAISLARSVALQPGFTLALWTGPDGTPVEEAVAGLGDALTALFTWDAVQQRFLTYNPSGPGFLNTAERFRHGEGVWLLADRAATWEQPAP